MTDKAALLTYSMWRELRTATEMHNVLCDCARCSKRRRLGAMLNLPHSGAPRDIRFKEKRA